MLMDLMPHANRTSLRRLLLRKGVDMPLVRDLKLKTNPRFRRCTPAFQLRWRDDEGRRHLAIYYFCAGQPYLEMDGKAVPLTLEEVQIHGLCKEKE